MTLTFTLRAHQGRNGSPINLAASQFSDDIADSYPNWGVGLKTTSGAPATFAALARWDGPGGMGDAFYDRSDQRSSGAHSGATRTLWRDMQRIFKRQPLDANYVAGRYLWIVAFASGTPSGSDVPLYTAGPYLIR